MALNKCIKIVESNKLQIQSRSAFAVFSIEFNLACVVTHVHVFHDKCLLTDKVLGFPVFLSINQNFLILRLGRPVCELKNAPPWDQDEPL